jgi:hypothetical protein
MAGCRRKPCHQPEVCQKGGDPRMRLPKAENPRERVPRAQDLRVQWKPASAQQKEHPREEGPKEGLRKAAARCENQ